MTQKIDNTKINAAVDLLIENDVDFSNALGESGLRGCPRSYYPGSNLCIIRLIIDIFTQASLLNVVRS